MQLAFARQLNKDRCATFCASVSSNQIIPVVHSARRRNAKDARRNLMKDGNHRERRSESGCERQPCTYVGRASDCHWEDSCREKGPSSCSEASRRMNTRTSMLSTSV